MVLIQEEHHVPANIIRGGHVKKEGSADYDAQVSCCA